MTPFVQPCDAGIIRCLKAHYRKAYCMCALQLEEADERDIYKINIREAMILVEEAWEHVTTDTIAHCRKHTLILPTENPILAVTTPSNSLSNFEIIPTVKDLSTWKILQDFATTEMGLPEAEAKLQACLGSRYNHGDWVDAYHAVMCTENNSEEAVKALDAFTNKIFGLPLAQALIMTVNVTTSIQQEIPLPVHPTSLQIVENELQDCVDELKRHKRIIGAPLTL
ncbi:hypothetical protein M422DRAFT_46281 [Sphaerobolus stellatus SS14]|uniref:DDE-1 domain-containing protein n=1 Tax=Sphaerobolus stellatus (strain SS14) TaxID=990650 RepID=A0A0C9W4H5_SPHS4|nr:hypothetical protein M422DRAFT_46281 [Sphaerobolus stellatus SS14]